MRESINFETELAKFTDKQLELCKMWDSTDDSMLLYGGSYGGGASYLLRWFAVRFLMKDCKKKEQVTVMLACHDYPTLKDTHLLYFKHHMPSWLGKFYSDHDRYGTCFVLSSQYGSGVIRLCSLTDPTKYGCSEFAGIFIDNLEKISYETFALLLCRLRYTGFKVNETLFLGAYKKRGGWIEKLWFDQTGRNSSLSGRGFNHVYADYRDNPHLDKAGREKTGYELLRCPQINLSKNNWELRNECWHAVRHMTKIIELEKEDGTETMASIFAESHIAEFYPDLFKEIMA